MVTFNTDGMVTQYFPFRASLMDYIFKNLQPQHLIKLYPTCKFFYATYGQHIIQHLEVVDDGEPEIAGLFKTVICASNPALPKLKDFWISDSFILRTSAYAYKLPEFSHMTIKKLELFGSICWEDYKMLTKPDTIEKLKVAANIYHFLNGGYYIHASPIEEVIAQVPNANSIEISHAYFSSSTCKSLLSLNHNVKVTNFILRDIYEIWNIKIDMFTDFVLKNAAPECNFHLDSLFHDSDDEDAADEYLNKSRIEIGKKCTAKIKSALKKKKIRDSNIS